MLGACCESTCLPGSMQVGPAPTPSGASSTSPGFHLRTCRTLRRWGVARIVSAVCKVCSTCKKAAVTLAHASVSVGSVAMVPCRSWAL